MKKVEREVYDRVMETASRLEKYYFKQQSEIKKLCDYIEIRMQQLQYAESKEEMEFVLTYLRKIL